MDQNKGMDIPEGFAPSQFPRRVPFVERIGPTFMRYPAAGGVDVGAWITEANRNGGRMAHGAFLITLADMATAQLALREAGPGRSAVHISLGMDFFAAAPVGCWVEARARIDRKGSSILFCGCEFYISHDRSVMARRGSDSADDSPTTGEEKIGRATAVMKILTLRDPGDAQRATGLG